MAGTQADRVQPSGRSLAKFQGTYAPEDAPWWVRMYFSLIPGWRLNLLAFYSKYVFKVLVWLICITGLDKVLEGPVSGAATRVLANVAWFFGARGKKSAFRSIDDGTGSGKPVAWPVSLINNVDPCFHPPTKPDGEKLYSAAEFPRFRLHSDDNGFNEWVAHFLALCMKVAYEEPTIVEDVANKDWGFQFHGAFYSKLTVAKLTLDPYAATYIPQTRSFVVSNANSVVVIFRGTEPLNLINWFSDGEANMAERENAFGQVHTGFYEALHWQDSDGKSVFGQLVSELTQARHRGKAVFVTGHSLGGALVTVFAHTLARRAELFPKGPEAAIHEAIVAKGGGVYTFAGPRAGDLEFAAYTSARYRRRDQDKGCIFRMVHSADLVPKVPTINLNFRHHAKEYFITTFGYVLDDPEDIAEWRQREASGFKFIVLYWYKIISGVTYFHENFLRTLERIVMFFLAPGFTDHWPSDYEGKLRSVALNVEPASLLAAQSLVGATTSTTSKGMAAAQIQHPSKAVNTARRHPAVFTRLNNGAAQVDGAAVS